MGEAEVDATGSHQDQDARTLGERRDCERAETRSDTVLCVRLPGKSILYRINRRRERSKQPSEQKMARYKCHHLSERGSETSTAWRLK